jgi:malonyl-CoA O-methyltransferase
MRLNILKRMVADIPLASEALAADFPPILDGQLVRNFDRLAASRFVQEAANRRAPWLHEEVARRMAERLSLIKVPPGNVLEWWGGLGASGTILRQALPKVGQWWVVEPTADWERSTRLQRQDPWWRPSRWRDPQTHVISESPAGGQAGLPAEEFELIWANMVLPYEANPPERLQHWKNLLAVNGYLMFSSLGPDSLREIKAIYRQHGWGAAATEFIDMHDLGDMMVRAGFSDPVVDQEILTLTWPSPEEALAELRRWGRNTALNRYQGLRTRAWGQQLRQAMGQHLAQPSGRGRVSLSLEVVYGHAFKAAPEASAPGETRVGLEEMRALMRSARRGG